MTYADAIHFLYGLRWFGTKLGLEHTFKLAALAGNPHERLRFIHVAGTNGKGSTCAMLESIYRAAGLRVGLFTSPHLVSFGERIQINREPIPEEAVVRLVSDLRDLLARFSPEDHPTFFEVITVMALRYFAEQSCDLVVWETGLGGRLDATNIVTPLVSVITNIQYDHQKWLGETLASIAAEKAGIIKPGIPLVTGVDEPEAFEVIKQTAQQQGASMTLVGPAGVQEPPLDRIQLPLLGRHQKLNAAVALAAVRALQASLPVAAGHIRLGFETVRWSGRLQLVPLGRDRQLLLDGAHNIGGVQMLRAALEEHFPGKPVTLILGILQDKDWPGMCQLLAPLARRVLSVPVHTDRTAAPHGLAEVCSGANPAAQVIEHSSLAAALADTDGDPFVVVAGSLYLIGEAMELLELSTPQAASERALNEWGNIRQPGAPALSA
jgi:dihydrofolate synthase / folylpolyglutamate synthase